MTKEKLIELSKIFNMKAICENYGLSYETYRSIVYGKRNASETTLNKFAEAFKEIKNRLEI